MARLTKKLNDAAESAEELAEQGKAYANRKMGKARRQIEDLGDDSHSLMEDAMEGAGELARTVASKGQKSAAVAKDYATDAMQTNPMAVMAGAFAAGMVVASLFRR